VFNVLVSRTYAARWNGSIAFALLLHLVVIRVAIGSTSSRTADMPAVRRDTIRLELARVALDPPRGSESPQAARDDLVPIAPLIPPIPVRDMKAPHLEFTYEGDPIPSWPPCNMASWRPAPRPIPPPWSPRASAWTRYPN
jgi:hypothetical protein